MPLPFPTIDNGVFTSEHLRGRYEGFQSATTYRHNSGKVGVPLACPDPQGATVRVVQMHQPVTFRVYEWVAVRRREKPVLPDPLAFAHPGEVLKDATVTPEPPQLAEDGVTHIYRVTGVYVYIQTRPVVPGKDTLQPGGTPFDRTPANA